jgi:hypothetical protein
MRSITSGSRIADMSDGIYDAVVFLAAGGIRSPGNGPLTTSISMKMIEYYHPVFNRRQEWRAESSVHDRPGDPRDDAGAGLDSRRTGHRRGGLRTGPTLRDLPSGAANAPLVSYPDGAMLGDASRRPHHPVDPQQRGRCCTHSALCVGFPDSLQRSIGCGALLSWQACSARP